MKWRCCWLEVTVKYGFPTDAVVRKISFLPPTDNSDAILLYHMCWSKHSISPDPKKIQALKHMEFPPDIENMPSFIGNQFLQGKEKSTLGTKLKPFVDTCTSTSSKDTHKKGRMTATIGMTDITPKTVNMVTTHILMSVHPKDSFSKKLD